MLIEINEGSKPKVTTKIFKDEDILKAKEAAELFYIENIFKGFTSVELYMEDENSELSIDISEVITIENAKLEANLISRISGKKIVPIEWEKRYQKLFESYAAKLPIS